MIKRWYNTNAAQVAGMVNVDDERILFLSNGAVTKTIYNAEDEEHDNVEGTVNDAEIFGNLLFGEERKTKEESMRMGHIPLDMPVVNIQYYRGRKPILAKSLGISMQDLEKVIYMANYIVVEEGDTELKYKELLNEAKYKEVKEVYENRFTALMGAEAIAYLLEKEQIADRTYMILHNIPVLPISMRYIYTSKNDSACGKEHYGETGLNKLYESVLMRNNRLSRLKELGAPDIIIRNEKRMLQEKVDALISNGARGIAITGYDYVPLESLNELYECITEPVILKHQMPEQGIDVQSFFTELKAHLDYCREAFKEDEMLPEDDPRCLQEKELERAACESVRTFVNAYIELNYKRYEEFADTVFHYVTVRLVDYATSLCEKVDEGKFEIEDVRKMLEEALAKQVDLYIRKQLKWHIERNNENE